MVPVRPSWAKPLASTLETAQDSTIILFTVRTLLHDMTLLMTLLKLESPVGEAPSKSSFAGA
jgi:hypothetical protein